MLGVPRTQSQRRAGRQRNRPAAFRLQGEGALGMFRVSRAVERRISKADSQAQLVRRRFNILLTVNDYKQCVSLREGYMATSFEQMVKKLGLSPEQYKSSVLLKDWVR